MRCFVGSSSGASTYRFPCTSNFKVEGMFSSLDPRRRLACPSRCGLLLELASSSLAGSSPAPPAQRRSVDRVSLPRKIETRPGLIPDIKNY